jgi:hypothetical protein
MSNIHMGGLRKLCKLLILLFYRGTEFWRGAWCELGFVFFFELGDINSFAAPPFGWAGICSLAWDSPP